MLETVPEAKAMCIAGGFPVAEQELELPSSETAEVSGIKDYENRLCILRKSI